MSTTRIIDAVATYKAAKRAELVQAVEAALVDYDAAYAVFADTAEAADAALAAAVDAKDALNAYDNDNIKIVKMNTEEYQKAIEDADSARIDAFAAAWSVYEKTVKSAMCANNAYNANKEVK